MQEEIIDKEFDRFVERSKKLKHEKEQLESGLGTFDKAVITMGVVITLGFVGLAC